MASALNSSLLALENQYYIPFPLYCTVYSIQYIFAFHAHEFLLHFTLHQSSSNLPFYLNSSNSKESAPSKQQPPFSSELFLLPRVSSIKAAASLSILTLLSPKSQLNQSSCLPFHLNSSFSQESAQSKQQPPFYLNSSY